MTSMKLICRHCRNKFEGTDEKFCSVKCKEIHILELEKRIKEITKNDPSHTKKMSDD